MIKDVAGNLCETHSLVYGVDKSMLVKPFWVLLDDVVVSKFLMLLGQPSSMSLLNRASTKSLTNSGLLRMDVNTGGRPPEISLS